MQNFSKNDRLLSLKQVNFSISHRLLLNNINLDFPQGSLNVLIGANGTGKSTLMRLMTGFLKPTSGEIWLNHQPLHSYSAAQLAKQRAVMKQHSAFVFPFLAEEVIRMGGHHRPAKAVEQAFAEVVEATDCASLCGKLYPQLSGGEQQRIQLARALLQLWESSNEPNAMAGKILFLDEPTSAFDLHHQQHCLRLLSRLCKEQGLTVCCILHDLNLAALYADQILLLANQQLQAIGTPQAVLTQAQIQQAYQADVHLIEHHQVKVPQVLLNK